MKMLFLCPVNPFSEIGGGANRMTHLIESYAKYNHVGVLCFDSANSHAVNVFSNRVKVWSVVKKETLCSQLKRYFCLQTYPFYPQFYSMLMQLLASEDWDVIISEKFYMAPYLEKIKNIPVIIDLWAVGLGSLDKEIDFSKKWMKKLRLRLQRFKLNRYDVFGFNHFKNFFVVSKNDQFRALSYNPKLNTCVLPNCVDWNKVKNVSEPVDSKTIAFVGDMSFKPNIDAVSYFCEDIFPLIQKQVPGVRFKIIGKNPAKKILKYRSSSVIVTGYVEDAYREAAKALIIVAPLRIGAGTRLKILEAMALGKAVVTTSAGAEGIEGENGKDFLIEDLAENFSNTVLHLMQYPERAAEIGFNARALVQEKYIWESAVCKSLDFIKQVCHE